MTRLNSTQSRLAVLVVSLLVGAAAWGANAPTAGTAPSASASAGHGIPTRMPKKKPPAAPVKRVDLNSASKAELKKIPGIGDAEAAKIIAARPFKTKTELVDKKILEVGPYLSIKNRVVATQQVPSQAKAKR